MLVIAVADRISKEGVCFWEGGIYLFLDKKGNVEFKIQIYPLSGQSLV